MHRHSTSLHALTLTSKNCRVTWLIQLQYECNKRRLWIRRGKCLPVLTS